MNGINITDIIKDIESLNTIVDYGSEKLHDFFAQIAERERRLMEISSRDVLSKFMDELQVLRGSLHVTAQSLKGWKEQANGYLQKLHESMSHSSLESGMIQENLPPIAASVTTLLKKMTAQLQDIQHQNNKLASLSHSIQTKKNHLPTQHSKIKPLRVQDDTDDEFEFLPQRVEECL